jgi:hypothetical protein
MKSDERMAERIAHLESDIKILKNEVQAVLVDLRDKYQETENPFNVSSAPATPKQVDIPQESTANEAGADTELHSSSEKKEVRDKTQEPVGASEAGKQTHPEKVKKVEKAKLEEPMGVSDSGRETHPEAARQEVLEAQISEEVSTKMKPQRKQISGRDINMIAIGGLVSWAEESVKKLGLQKTEAILDVAEMMGLLSPQFKQILTKLIHIDSDGNSQSVSARVFLDSLVKITTLLGKDNQTVAALLSILAREDDHG